MHKQIQMKIQYKLKLINCMRFGSIKKNYYFVVVNINHFVTDLFQIFKKKKNGFCNIKFTGPGEMAENERVK